MSSEDEQEDNGIFDQLKSIKPFTIDQLYLLHPDVGCPPTTASAFNAAASSSDQPRLDSYHDNELYQNLIEFERLRVKLADLRDQVKKFNAKTFVHADKIWVLKEESERRIGMCQQGKIAETTFKYKKASMNRKQLDVFNFSFNELADIINKEYIYYSFESQMKLYKIATELSISYQIADASERSTKLKMAIATLMNFIKHLGESKSEFTPQCRKWLRGLVKRFLEREATEDFQFIVSQISRGPPGTADWMGDLIECKPFEQVNAFESIPQYISHCSILLSELFNSFRVRAKSEENLENKTTDQNWSLIDPRFSCSEELNASGNILTECDLIKICSRVPVAQIFRAYVKKCLDSDHFDKNYEYVMLKLLTIGTIIIKTYQVGLETFNSIRYGNLIEYLSCQIRRTVIVLSDQWAEFKRRLKGTDDALLMRLQVEYDNFILRSILIILELRQSGIWRHLSRNESDGQRADNDASNSWSVESLHPAFMKLLQVTGLTSANSQPGSTTSHQQTRHQTSSSSSLTYEFSTEWFKEVSEPMLWHILWQFYHNAFTSSCDYHSDNYWLQKFSEKSVVYLFINKIEESPPGECSYLLNSLTSMVLSRARSDSKLINFIATEMFDLSFRHSSTKSKIAQKGIRSLTRCAEKFPNMISLYLNFMLEDEEVDSNTVDLFKGCSLTGWICNEEEMDVLANWLVEYPLTSAQNKIARIVISKLLLNSPQSEDKSRQTVAQSKRRKSQKDCVVHLRMRRRIALLLYEACVVHLKEVQEITVQSLGASVEVAFGSLYCEPTATSHKNLLELSVDTNYQQLYVWAWRLLFTLRLHFLNQPNTDWNDVQSRSETSRSTKNTVLVEDSFHLVPSIQDSECLSLSEGVKKENPMALFIYLLMTDVTWQTDTLDDCFRYLNLMVDCGHLTPSLMAMKYIAICHLNDITGSVAKDQKCHNYFSNIITSNFDSNRLASLMMSQLDKLKPNRQLQLSRFYTAVLIEVAAAIDKESSSSWFSGNEHSLEKIACLLDYIVKFNFSTQRAKIIHIFYDCSYSVQAAMETSGWFGSLFASNTLNINSTKREFLTTLHVLAQKYKNYTWLRWITTECDTIKLEKIWEAIVDYLSSNEDTTLDSAMKKVCPQINGSLLKSMLPIYSWVKQIFDIMENELNHPLFPLIWYNFFLNYFANSLNGVSVGMKLIPPETRDKLMSNLDSLFNYHSYKQRNWASPASSSSHVVSVPMQQNSLAHLYQAYRQWLRDPSLSDAYVDIDRLRADYLVPLLKAVMESSTEGAYLQYIDLQSIETQNKNLIQVWSTATRLEGNHLAKDMVFVGSNHDDSMDVLTSVDDEIASDATSLIATETAAPELSNKLLASAEKELQAPVQKCSEDVYKTLDETIQLVKDNFNIVFKESTTFGANLGELEKTRGEIVELIQKLYTNRKRELVRVVPCVEGNECPGPARIKMEVEEAALDERKSQCIQDRRRQCEEVVVELLSMPTNRVVHSTVAIEEAIKQLASDPGRSKQAIEHLFRWISEPQSYSQLNGSFYPANYLLKILLEVLSIPKENIDTYNVMLADVCLQHPGGVQIFSPFLSPSSCSSECFLDLYKKVSQRHSALGPIPMFVILSKFDVNLWLKSIRNKEMHHELIRTTCSALKSMGNDPDESFVSTFELYRRHLHLELAPPDRRKPEEILLVLNLLLEYMSEHSIAPSLWLDFMFVLGLEKSAPSNGARNSNSDNVSRSTIMSPNKSVTSTTSQMISANESILSGIDGEDQLRLSDQGDTGDISRLAERQVILDYQTLNRIMQILSEFSGREIADMTLLELYSDYLNEFSIVMMSICFMWLKAVGDLYPDNHELIWKQFIGCWYDWVFLSKNCQNVGKVSYNLMANNFVSTLKYMIQKMPDSKERILQSTLSTLTQYVIQTKEVVYLELTILQRCLERLPWSSLLASPEDFENLAILSEQENYNISDLVSHIVLQLNLKDSLRGIANTASSDEQEQQQTLAHVAERLATVIILQSSHLKGFRPLASGNYFSLIPVDQVSRLAALILPRMEFANLEYSQTNKLLVNLLRSMCIKYETGDDIEDSFSRSIVYGQFVSNYLVNLIKNHPTVLEQHEAYLCAVVDNSLEDLKVLVSADFDANKKTTIYANLLECCNCNSLTYDSRLYIGKCLLRSNMLKNRPIVMLEIFHSIGKVIRDGQILVHLIESLVGQYLHAKGHYDTVLKNFCLKVLPGDIYLNACIEENAPLALLVYFESLYRSGAADNEQSDSQLNVMAPSGLSSVANLNNSKIWCSFIHWVAQLSDGARVGPSNQAADQLTSIHTRLIIVWLRLLQMLETNLEQFVACGPQEPAKSSGGDPQSDAGSVGSQSMSGGNPAKQPTSEKESLNPSHKSIVNLIKNLILIFDSSKSGGLWSYLKSTSSGLNAKLSLIALSVACFLSDRILICIGADGQPKDLLAFRSEVTRTRKLCLTKLESARKSKVYDQCTQYIETLIESVKQNDKVQFSEGVQLISLFAKQNPAASDEDLSCLNRILPSLE